MVPSHGYATLWLGRAEAREMSARSKRWIAWAAFAMAFALWVNSGVLGWLTRSAHINNGWGESSDAVELAFALILATFPVVGLLIALRRPRRRRSGGCCWRSASSGASRA